MTTASLRTEQRNETLPTYFYKVRGFFRVTRALLHLLGALGVVAFVYPVVSRAVRLWLKQRWSRQLVGILGVKIKATARASNEKNNLGTLRGLLISNHISWLDVYVIHALAPSAFVCKAEVRDWPLIGWLCEKTECIFIERGSRTAARNTNTAIGEQLKAGIRVAVFPEGTTADGKALLPFHSALFQSAIDAENIIQPLRVSYVSYVNNVNFVEEHCARSDIPAYCGDTSLWQSLCAIACAPALTVCVDAFAEIEAKDKTRQQLSATTHQLITAALIR